MATVKVYNKEGKELKDLKLNSDIFDVKVNVTTIHQVVVSMMNNQRQVLAHTKGRGEVRGGGRKPWRQKGTGRARHGSNRSPIWIGGGVTFGPTNERNFTKAINKKMKRKALFMALADKVAAKGLMLVDGFDVKEYKTKNIVELLKNLNLQKSVLLVTENQDDKFVKSVANLPRVDVIDAKNLNVLEVVKYKTVLASVPALDKMEQTFLAQEKKTVKEEKKPTKKVTDSK